MRLDPVPRRHLGHHVDNQPPEHHETRHAASSQQLTLSKPGCAPCTVRTPVHVLSLVLETTLYVCGPVLQVRRF